MRVPVCSFLSAFVVLAPIFGTVVNQEAGRSSSGPAKKAKPSDFRDEAVINKLKQKKLVSQQMVKPEECDYFAEKNDEVQVHYTGYLETGQIFDSSEKSDKEPITFVLGSGQVIQGWEEGLIGMCPGEKRRLIIPPNLAYGKQGFPPVIPPDATLMFEVTLLGLRKNSQGQSIADPEYMAQLLKFLFLPGVIVYVFYYLYGRYKAETEAVREQKHLARGKNSRKKK